MSLISTYVIEDLGLGYDLALDYYSYYSTIDDTDVFEQQGGYIKMSGFSGSSLQVIYYFGGNDWREYSASFPNIQSELYPERAGDGNYLYDIQINSLRRDVGAGFFIFGGRVYNPSESKYYPGIFVIRIYVDENGNTQVGRYGKPVASFVENDGFGRYERRTDATWNGLVVGAPEQEGLNGGGAVYYYMWTPNI